MSRFKLKLVGDKDSDLEAVLKIIFAKSKAKGFSVNEDGLRLFWNVPESKCGDESICDLPFKMAAESGIAFIKEWLAQSKHMAEGGEQSCDGMRVMGFTIESMDEQYCFLRVRPTWIYYGK